MVDIPGWGRNLSGDSDKSMHFSKVFCAVYHHHLSHILIIVWCAVLLSLSACTDILWHLSRGCKRTFRFTVFRAFRGTTREMNEILLFCIVVKWCQVTLKFTLTRIENLICWLGTPQFHRPVFSNYVKINNNVNNRRTVLPQEDT